MAMIKERDNNNNNNNKRGNDVMPMDLPRGTPSQLQLQSLRNSGKDEIVRPLLESGIPLDSRIVASKLGDFRPNARSICLSLDMRSSLESKTENGTYVLRFNPIETLRGIQLNSFICPNYRVLGNEPNLGLRIENLPSRYGNLNLFSRMNVGSSVNNYIHYKPGESDPLFLEPGISNFNYIEFALRTWDDQPIHLEQIDVEQILRNTKNGTMKIICRELHHLSINDPISLTVSNPKSVIGYRLDVLKISDEKTFITAIPNTMNGEISVTTIYPRVTLNFTVF